MSSLSIFNVEQPHCTVCGLKPGSDLSGNFICTQCLKHHPNYDLARHALPFDGIIRRIIHEYKYNRAIWLKDDLVDILEALTRNAIPSGDIDLILPVPLSRRKFIKRGFNQSALLAYGLARRLSIPFNDDCLIRIKDTPTQTHLGIEKRKENIKGAFKVATAAEISERRILIVDDVMTTGATLNEIAKALKQNGAQSVSCIALARADMGKI